MRTSVIRRNIAEYRLLAVRCWLLARVAHSLVGKKRGSTVGFNLYVTSNKCQRVKAVKSKKLTANSQEFFGRAPPLTQSKRTRVVPSLLASHRTIHFGLRHARSSRTVIKKLDKYCWAVRAGRSVTHAGVIRSRTGFALPGGINATPLFPFGNRW